MVVRRDDQKAPRKRGVVRAWVHGLFRGCMWSLLGSIFLIALIGIIAIIVFLVRYELWLGDVPADVHAIINEESGGKNELRSTLNERLLEFQQSTVQKEALWMDCSTVNVYVEDVAQKNWGMSAKDVGVTCANRSLTIYVKVWGLWWTGTRLWQRTEGSVDLIVFDVTVGPVSLAGLSFGSLSGSMSKGMQDAIELTSENSLTGNRKIEELYIDARGIRMVGSTVTPSDL